MATGADGGRLPSFGERAGRRLPGGAYTGFGMALVALVLFVALPWPGTSSPAMQVETAGFHHLHLNVTDRQATIDYYEKFFGTYEVMYRDRSPALFTERSFLLLDEVAQSPRTHLGTALWHVGWAGVDGETEFQWRTREGIEVETPISSLRGSDENYMYFWGPDGEVIEVYTGSRNHRFEHIHLLANDPQATARWFERHLGMEPRGSANQVLRVDNINVIIWQAQDPDEERPYWYPPSVDRDLGVTDGSAIDHLAFSYTDTDPVFERMEEAGAEIVRPIRFSQEHGHRSFRSRRSQVRILSGALPKSDECWDSGTRDECPKAMTKWVHP